QTKLYKLIGFEPAKLITPQFLLDWKITNPDAPNFNVFMNLKISEEETVKVCPVGYFDPEETEGPCSFPNYRTRLLVLIENEDNDGEFRAEMIDDTHLRLLNGHDYENFWEQVGLNTKYISHPEEILADNFAYLMLESTVETPDLLINMDKLLKGEY
ncbi:unnamed protein product, partial [marine sediment metagenome]